MPTAPPRQCHVAGCPDVAVIRGLAQAYALRLADRLVDQIDDAIEGNVGDFYAAFLQGFGDFFTESAADPGSL